MILSDLLMLSNVVIPTATEDSKKKPYGEERVSIENRKLKNGKLRFINAL